MQEPILPRNSWKDPHALRQRMERAAESVQKDEARARSSWAALGLALAMGVISGCSPSGVPPATSPAYGIAPLPVTQTASPSPQPPSPTP